jgi:hypothetical protein
MKVILFEDPNRNRGSGAGSRGNIIHLHSFAVSFTKLGTREETVRSATVPKPCLSLTFLDLKI